MAINLEDTSSGFRHMDVVMFLNEEVLKNGSRSDFYSACRSLHWPEVEDRLQAVLGDPQMPRSTKRACAWSALALGVRVAARQRDKQARRVRKLQNQMAEREMTSKTLTKELQRLQKEREELTMRLHRMRYDLQQSLEERQRLLTHLLHDKSSAQVVEQGNRAKQQGTKWSPQESMAHGKMAAVGAEGIGGAWSQTGAKEGQSGALSSWASGVNPYLPLPYSHLYSYPTQFPMGYPYSWNSTLVVKETETATVPFQAPSVSSYRAGMWAALGSQGEMASEWNKRSQVKTTGTVTTTFMQLSEHRWTQGDPGKESPQEHKTWAPKAPETFQDAEEAPSSRM